MELKDLVVAPLLFIVVLTVAYVVRPAVTDAATRPYFFPGLLVKLFGAIAVGLLYQFYYTGGDTFNYHTYGSRVLWEAFWDSPSKAMQLCFGDPHHVVGISKYASRILFLDDPGSYFIVRIAFLFDLFTFSTYSATAICFAVLAFIGAWMLFLTFYQRVPHLHKWIAVACLFMPSVFFWGSGILKDSVCMAFLGIATYYINRIFVMKRFSVTGSVLLIVSLWLIYNVKVYILLCYVPAAFVLVYLAHFASIRSVVLKAMLFPFITAMIVLSAFYGVQKIAEDDPKYALSHLAKTARVTAYDIRYYSGKDAGSGYALGELDGSFQGLITLFPAAINVTLYRPYVWEVKNPLMALSSLESLAMLIFTIFVLIKVKYTLFKALTDPYILFCLLFAFVFAFAIGVSTYNFGTLARYKIPLIPYYIIGMALLLDYRSRNTTTEADG